jgi:HPr kinase/phosphorylase
MSPSGLAARSADRARLERVLVAAFESSRTYCPPLSIHGVLVEVYGLGILILATPRREERDRPRVIERGHRLVADDVVEISCVNGNSLIGQGANRSSATHGDTRARDHQRDPALRRRSIRERKEVQIVAKLEEWDANKVYDRIGT